MLKSAADGFLQTALTSHLHQVVDLVGAGDQQHIDLAIDDLLNGALERSDIFRKSPLVDGHWSHQSAARLQAMNQFAVGNPVFLQGDALSRQRHPWLVLIKGSENVPPRVGFRNDHGDRDSKLPQRRHRFRAARNHRQARQRLHQLFTRMFRCHGTEKDAGAHSRQEDHRIKLSCEKVFGEG